MGNILSILYYSCKKKKILKVSPLKVSPLKVSKLHKRKISDELDDVLYEYRKTHPQTLIIDSPRYGLDKREVLKNFGLSNHYIKS